MCFKYIYTLICLILLLAAAYNSNAQAGKITLSEKHIRKLDKIKNGNRRIVKFHKFYKRDSLAFVRKSSREKNLKGTADVVTDVLRNKYSPTEASRYSQLIRTAKDSSRMDSLQQRGQALFVQKLGIDTLSPGKSFPELDSGTLTQVLKLPSELNGPEELEQLGQNAPDVDRLISDQLGDAESLESELAKVPSAQLSKLPQADLRSLSQEDVTDLSKKVIDQPLFSELSPVVKARESVSKLLSKYRNYSNSNDLSDATKANSLKGKTFTERLVFSSDFNIVSIQPLSLDMSASVGFRFSQRLLSGLGGTYRLTMKDSIESARYISPSNIGLKFHVAYDIWPNTYMYGEATNTKASIQNDDQVGTQWVYKYSVGLGRRIVIGPKLYLTTTITYAINHRDQATLYANRFQIRIGFQTTELANRKSKLYYNPNE